MPSEQSVVDMIRGYYYRMNEKKEIEKSKGEALKRNIDKIACDKIKYDDVFFDYDDTLVSGWKNVNMVDSYETLNNLKATKEACGYPRLHIVSFNSRKSLEASVQRNKMTEYFDTVHATGNDKSGAIANTINQYNTTPEKSLMVGHDLEYDYLPIKENPMTREVNTRLLSDRLSVYDSSLRPEKKAQLKGICYVKSINWRDMKPILDGSDKCVEDTTEAVNTADAIAFENLFGFRAFYQTPQTTQPEKTYDDVWDEYDKKYGKDLEWK